MNYQQMKGELQAVGIGAPEVPGPRNPTLRYGILKQDGQPICGAYLNEVNGTAFITLRYSCPLRYDPALWNVMTGVPNHLLNEKRRNIVPKNDVRGALEQLFYPFPQSLYPQP